MRLEIAPNPAVSLLGVLILLGSFSFAGQFSSIQHDATQDVDLWGAVSLHTTSLGGLSQPDVRGRKLVLGGLRYSRALAGRGNFLIHYTFDIIPVALAFHSGVGNGSASSGAARKNVY